MMCLGVNVEGLEAYGRLAVSGGCHRFVLQESGWVEHELTDESDTGLRCIANGDLVASATAGVDCATGLVDRSMPAKHTAIY